jgi:DNA-binding transcriptional ArsR family regulator
MTQPLWSQRFFASTRGRIVALLRRIPMTVDQLAQALELTDNAVRAQLAGLERDGIVRPDGIKKGTSKPSVAYSLIPDVEPLLSRAYRPLLHALLDTLAERLPDREQGCERPDGHWVARLQCHGATWRPDSTRPPQSSTSSADWRSPSGARTGGRSRAKGARYRAWCGSTPGYARRSRQWWESWWARPCANTAIARGIGRAAVFDWVRFELRSLRAQAVGSVSAGSRCSSSSRS